MKEILVIITLCYLVCVFVFVVLKKNLYYKDDERGQMIIRNSSITSFASINLTNYISILYYEKVL